MPRYFLIAILAISYVTSFCQSPKVARSPSEAVALLAKTKALYDTPFQAGLINFDSAIDFDFDQYLKSNLGEAARTDSPLAQLLKPIRYRVSTTLRAGSEAVLLTRLMCSAHRARIVFRSALALGEAKAHR